MATQPRLSCRQRKAEARRAYANEKFDQMLQSRLRARLFLDEGICGVRFASIHCPTQRVLVDTEPLVPPSVGTPLRDEAVHLATTEVLEVEYERLSPLSIDAPSGSVAVQTIQPSVSDVAVCTVAQLPELPCASEVLPRMHVVTPEAWFTVPPVVADGLCECGCEPIHCSCQPTRIRRPVTGAEYIGECGRPGSVVVLPRVQPCRKLCSGHSFVRKGFRIGCVCMIYTGPGGGKTTLKTTAPWVLDTDETSDLPCGSIVLTNRWDLCRYAACSVCVIPRRETWDRRCRVKCEHWTPTWYDDLKDIRFSVLVYSDRWLSDVVTLRAT